MPFEEVTIGPCRLIRADCLEVLPTLEAGSVDAIITDPPYGIDYQSARRTDKSQWKPKIANDCAPFIWFMPSAFRAAKDDSCMFIFCRWDVQEPFRDAATWSGWRVKMQVIWDRESHGMGDLNGSPAPQHDVCWFAVKGDFKFHGERPKSIIRECRLGGVELVHPNEKPEGLMIAIVESYAPKCGLVCDPCMGSATTGVACLKTGREFIGCEIDAGIFDIACRRIERAWLDERSKLPLPPPVVERQPELFGGDVA